MIVNEGAMFLNLLCIALMGLLVASALLAAMSLFTARLSTLLSARAQKKALWLFVTTPWTVSIICVLIFVPSLLQAGRLPWLSTLAHWHHPAVFYLDSWHGATLVLFILSTVYVLARRGLSAVRQLNTLNTLTRLSRRKTRLWTHGNSRHSEVGQDIVVLESQTPSAFAAGLLRPKCYVTTGLIERVSETELDIIIDHERAHIRHKDAQKKLLFALFASLYPRPLARRLNQLFSLASELQADARVSKSYCNFDIAQTLVSAARIQRFLPGNVNPALVNYFIADDVEYRVRALVDPQRLRSFPWTHCLLVVVLTTILSSIGVDSLHHLIEAFFSH